MNNKVIDSSNIEPLFFRLSNKKEFDDFLSFKEKNSNFLYIDTISEQLHELELVRNPSLINHNSLNEKITKEVSQDFGVWVFFPWRNTCVRILGKEEYEELRLSRNRNLLTQEEQLLLKEKNIGIAGLNVGNPGVVAIALEGVSNNFKLADLDALSVSNLNRFRAGLADLGVNKATISARQIYEINPYANIELFDNGVTVQNCEEYLNNPRIDLLIEEMDNLKLKIEIREKAKALRIPVLMATGNGENVLIDVERYDMDSDLKILSGFLKDEVIERVKNIKPGEGSYEERIVLAQDFMGKEYLDKRLVDSFDLVSSKKIASIPQLAESSFLRGATLCHFAKKILLGHDIKSGRYSISLSGEVVKII